MFVAKVTGSLVATQKVASMVGWKLLVVEPYRLEPSRAHQLDHHRPHVRRRRYARRRRRRFGVDHAGIQRPRDA
jgi:hypothetical protein